MSFSHGRPFLAIPGPSPLPDRVIRAMSRPSPDIYGGELLEVNRQVHADLKRVAGTEASLAMYIGNGHAGWEAANSNMLSRGDHALVLCSGQFGQTWAQTAEARGIHVERMDFGTTAPHPQRVAERLAHDKDHKIKAVLVCQIDTATSVRADIPALRAAIGKHPALLAVDAIASLGCEPMLMDEWGVDVLVSASQKGLMTPPGIAYVWFSDQAKARQGDLVTPYWDWTQRADATELWQYWSGTPPVQLAYAQHEALQMLLNDEGLEAAWIRHDALARVTWAAVNGWSLDNPGIALTVADRDQRAHSVTALSLPHADRLRAWCETKAGLILGIGLGADDPANALRIAHMGHVTGQQLLGTLATIEAGLVALDIPHGPGLAEAVKVLTDLA